LTTGKVRQTFIAATLNYPPLQYNTWSGAHLRQKSQTDKHSILIKTHRQHMAAIMRWLPTC